MNARTIVYSGHPLAIAHLPEMRAEEFQHVVYMPIAADGVFDLPDGLRWATPAIYAVFDHLHGARCPDLFTDWYVYLSVKHGWVDAGQAGNREGWHIDGFGSPGDKNFIWCDSTPTEYLKGTFVVPSDHKGCLERLAYLAGKVGIQHKPRNDLAPLHITQGHLETHTLYELGQTVHQPSKALVSGMRTFVKISVSRERYDLVGNARNPLLPSTHWPLKAREGVRNHPTSQPGGGTALSASQRVTPAPSHKSLWRHGTVVTPCTMMAGPVTVAATHGIHKGTQVAADTGLVDLHNEGSLA